MNEDNIGQIFRDAMKGFEKQPSQGVWNSIQGKLPVAKAPVKVNPLAKNLFISFSAIVVTTVLSILAYNHFSKNNTGIVNTSPVAQNVSVAPGQKADQPNTPVKETQVVQKKHTYPYITPSVINPVIKSDKDTALSKNQLISQQKFTDTIRPVVHVNTEKPVQNNNQNQNNQLSSSNKNNAEVENDDNLFTEKHSSDITYDQEKTICKGSAVTLHAGGGITYSWTNGETTDSIMVSPAVSTVYHVSITDKNGAIHDGIISVTVTDCNSYITPRAFTPNGDGVLDIFFAYVKDVKDFQMIIYSRAGEQVFESRNPDEGWDGTVKGMKAPVGVYVYIIKFIDAFGQQHDLKGSVTLVR